MNKIIKLIIAVFLITLFSFNTIYADDEVYTDGPFNYVLNEDGSIKIINYFGNDDKIEIPRAIGLYEIDGQYVPRYITIIAATTFESFQPEIIIIPDTVVYIEEGAIESGITIQYSDEQGNISTKENVEPIIIKPNENSDSNSDISQENYYDEDAFEEIGNQIDQETGEEKNIFEITENEQTQDTEDNFERKGISSSTFGEIKVSPFGYVLFGLIIIYIVYSIYKKNKNNKVLKEDLNVVEKKPQQTAKKSSSNNVKRTTNVRPNTKTKTKSKVKIKSKAKTKSKTNSSK